MRLVLRALAGLVTWAGAAALPGIAAASACLAVVEDRPPIRFANIELGGLGVDEVGLTYVGHSTFLIQDIDGNTIATDFAGYAGPGIIPRVVTMNHAHNTHYTDYPDPRIEHVLRGWAMEGKPADHLLKLGDTLIRNIPTAIINYAGGEEPAGNSIFVFEIGSLCIAHLGHLHHVPTDEQFSRIGLIDIVLAPVDGGFTLSHDKMLEVLDRLRARVVVPMHYFGLANLERFLGKMPERYAIRRAGTHSVVLSKEKLPSEPNVLVLQPYSDGDFGD